MCKGIIVVKKLLLLEIAGCEFDKKSFNLSCFAESLCIVISQSGFANNYQLECIV